MEKFFQNAPSIEKAETKSLFLNEWDKKYLEKGALGMINKIYQDFDNDFPDVIILPERGARPLYYLLNPIFNKLNLKKNTKIPKFVYFSVGKKAGINLTIQEQYGEVRTSDKLSKILAEDHPNLSAQTISNLVNREEVEDVMVARDSMKSRAEEIIEKNKDGLQLAIIDEVLSNGGTIREIRKAFNNEDLPAYTFIALSGHDGSAVSGYTFNEEDDTANPGVNGYSFSFEQAEDAIGVEKVFDQKYTSSIKKDTSAEQEKLAQDKKLLRTEMRDFGEELADKIGEVL